MNVQRSSLGALIKRADLGERNASQPEKSEKPHGHWNSKTLAQKAESVWVTKQPFPGHPIGKGSE